MTQSETPWCEGHAGIRAHHRGERPENCRACVRHQAASGGEPMPAWLTDNIPGVDNWEPIDSEIWRGRSQSYARTWIYAIRRGKQWAAVPITEEAVEDGGVLDYALDMLRRSVPDMSQVMHVRDRSDGLTGKAILLETPESMVTAAGWFQNLGWLAVPRDDGLEIALSYGTPKLIPTGRMLVFCGDRFEAPQPEDFASRFDLLDDQP